MMEGIAYNQAQMDALFARIAPSKPAAEPAPAPANKTEDRLPEQDDIQHRTIKVPNRRISNRPFNHKERRKKEHNGD